MHNLLVPHTQFHVIRHGRIAMNWGFDPRTVQPVGSRYTDYATRPSVT